VDSFAFKNLLIFFAGEFLPCEKLEAALLAGHSANLPGDLKSAGAKKNHGMVIAFFQKRKLFPFDV
jgi:hypothetical protein